MCLLHFTFHLKEKNYSVLRLSVRNLFTCLSSAEGLQDNSEDSMAHGEQPL